MIQWEYKIVWQHTESSSRVSGLLDHLNHLGKQGWELTAVAPEGFYLKRLKAGSAAGVAVKAVLTINKGDSMPGVISIDAKTASATVEFKDDHENVAAVPAGAVVTFTSDNPAIATIAPDPANQYKGDITPVSINTDAAGNALLDANGAPITCNIDATITEGTTGNQIMEPDGVTPFTVAPGPVYVGPGDAASADMVLVDK